MYGGNVNEINLKYIFCNIDLTFVSLSAQIKMLMLFVAAFRLIQVRFVTKPTTATLRRVTTILYVYRSIRAVTNAFVLVRIADRPLLVRPLLELQV